MSRFFAPDELTPPYRGKPWRIGDVFAVQHGPDPKNLFFWEITGVPPLDEAFPLTRPLFEPETREQFKQQIEQFIERAS